jgi:hypothetical protein
MNSITQVLAGKFIDPWYSRPGVVYFLSAGVGCEICKSIKIGVSTRTGLLRRLRSIQSSNHARIRLLGIIPEETMKSAEETERDWHNRFGKFGRFQQGTVGHEWFAAMPELAEAIAREVEPFSKNIGDFPNADVITNLFVG